MNKTLILTNKSNEKSSLVIGSIISHSKIMTYLDGVDYSKYDNLIMLLDLDQVMGEEIDTIDGQKTFLEITNNLKINFIGKNIKIGVLFEANKIYRLSDCINILKNNVVAKGNYVFINKDVENDAISSALDIKEEFESREKESGKVPIDKLRTKIDEFIKSHKTLNMATASSDIPRVTTIEYIYRGDCLYIITEGGVKFSNLLINARASVAIHDEFKSMANVRGLTMNTKSSLVDLYSDEYYSIMEMRGLDRAKLDALDIDLYIIKLEILEYTYVDFSLRRDGYMARQYMTK